MKKIKILSLLNRNDQPSYQVMIIAVDIEGQLCNRLWGFLPLLHHHRLTGERIKVLFFEAYTPFFPALAKGGELHCLRLLPDGVVNKQVRAVVKRLLKDGRFTYNQSFNQHRGGCSLVLAWEHRNEAHDEATRAMALALFRPTDAVLRRVGAAFEGLHTMGSILLGVHVRRGDYRFFGEGRYFYSDEDYLSFMLQIQEQVNRMGYSLSCLLCSDEPINVPFFQGVDVHCIPQSSSMDDLYALSCCDLIVGPPSTFSQWASYYGQVPLKLVWDKTAPINVTEFGLCTSLDQTRPVDMPAWFRERLLLRSAPQGQP